MFVFSRATAGLLLVTLSIALAGAAQQATPIQIGMTKSFFHERSKVVVEIVGDDFKEVIKKTTGLDGVLNSQHGAAAVAEKLTKQELAFGIFYAHEFAWMQKKYPELQPLLIAANKRNLERAHFIVHKDSPAKTIADLRAKKFDLPIGSIEPSRLYVERCCAYDAAFFSAIQKSKSQTDALNEVARGAVQATIVDTTELEAYKRFRGPVFVVNLRVLQQSDVFPPALIAYKQGGVEEKTLTQFRDGLLKAHTIQAGREMMKEWNVDAFEAIPKDYAKSLDDLIKAYPPPASLR